MIEIQHTLKIQEDGLTIKGKITNCKFLDGAKRGNRKPYYTKDEKFCICSYDYPELKDGELFVWGRDKEDDNDLIKYKCSSKEEAKQIMKYIQEFTIEKTSFYTGDLVEYKNKFYICKIFTDVEANPPQFYPNKNKEHWQEINKLFYPEHMYQFYKLEEYKEKGEHTYTINLNIHYSKIPNIIRTKEDFEGKYLEIPTNTSKRKFKKIKKKFKKLGFDIDSSNSIRLSINFPFSIYCFAEENDLVIINTIINSSEYKKISIKDFLRESKQNTPLVFYGDDIEEIEEEIEKFKKGFSYKKPIKITVGEAKKRKLKFKFKQEIEYDFDGNYYRFEPLPFLEKDDTLITIRKS